MTDDLNEALQTIDGVGPKTAEKAAGIFQSHGGGDTQTAKDALTQALDYFDDGSPGYAEKFVRNAYDAL